MKASPLLRTWMAGLTARGVRFRFHQTWTGWDHDGRLTFEGAGGACEAISAAAVVLALGGASWPRLGSDGRWSQIFTANGLAVTPLLPANVGFDVAWSPVFKSRFAGQPLKAVTLCFGETSVPGEILIAHTGIQGGGVYALSRNLRESLMAGRPTVLMLDLRPGLKTREIQDRLDRTRPGDSLANRLRKALRFGPLEIALLREAFGPTLQASPKPLADAIKAVPIRLSGVQSLERAISTAGGVPFDALTSDFMLKARPGTFLAGEMLDWEAPTGGYLLQACFATGKRAGEAALRHIRRGQGRGHDPDIP